MKNLFAFMLLFTMILGACNSNSEEQKNNTDSSQVAQANVYNVDDFDSIAGNFIDQEIQVKGIVDHVCKHSGKRLFLVGDNGDMHVDGEEKFQDSLTGSNVIVSGIVKEFRIDEAYCLQQEQDNIKSHSKGQTEKELFEQKKKQIAEYRDEMKTNNVDHLSYYTLEYKSLKTVNE